MATLPNTVPLIEVRIWVNSDSATYWKLTFGEHELHNDESDNLLEALEDIKQEVLSTTSNIIGRDFENHDAAVMPEQNLRKVNE